MTSVVTKSKVIHVHCYFFLPNNLFNLNSDHCTVCVTENYLVVIYRVSQEERTTLREGVPYVKLYRYYPKHLCPKLNGFRDNGK